MCHRPRQDLAPRALLLCPLWQAVWRRRVPWERRKALLYTRLLWSFRSQVWSLQPSDYRQLHKCLEQSMASWLFCLSGKILSLQSLVDSFANHALIISQDCRCPFIGGSFFDYEGQPYCEVHYHAKRGSLCAGCHKPISGRCITAMFRKFHPEHFVCSFCLKQLNKGTFKEQNDKPYCHSCFEKLFG